MYGTVPEVGIMEEDVSNIATRFDVVDFILAQGAEASQLVSEFFTEVICPCIVIQPVR